MMHDLILTRFPKTQHIILALTAKITYMQEVAGLSV